jgi:hypothetical protein
MPSSAIGNIDYNLQRREMTVTFTTGRRYVYQNVPSAVVMAFRSATSRGAYFNDEIRDRYSFHEIARAGDKLPKENNSEN